jgi:DNA-binding NarL/FixJ family response regulator
VAAKNVRLFIAEDSPHVLSALKTLILEIEGAELIGHASDAAIAAEQIRSANPDVAILDIQLSSGSGLDVLRSISRDESGAPVTIVFTSHVEAQLLRICRKLGADYVFNKAADIERLVSVLRALVELRSSASAGSTGEIP